eukprot:gnl/MRDRNA2_/MRDRNA2_66180_c0_seq4.p1 gnl/MRDRNA2_/MRDRNA2_66180_c0~~gnl/MRDRNA2_/MRDRNA2_66180_c0_seq4.p1  ORF type:complete len:101 (+),score=11.04 gnl/MRDRNA2_/MRDRNA2_66180_c0_seq4:205-507(+)
MIGCGLTRRATVQPLALARKASIENWHHMSWSSARFGQPWMWSAAMQQPVHAINVLNGSMHLVYFSLSGEGELSMSKGATQQPSELADRATCKLILSLTM